MTVTQVATMKAVRLHDKGGLEQLFYEDAPMPVPQAGQVRIRVHAAAITPTELTWGKTYENPDGSLRLPSIPAHDVSGVVDAIGPGARGVRVGDEVYALIDFTRDGAAAEYAVVPAADVAPKPKSLDHVQAAAVPLSALTAWQALIDHANLQYDQRVLVHGAAGGVGAYAVQLARYRGAIVAATASGRHADFLKDLGVDRMIDYEQTSFEQVLGDMDIVFDTVGGDTLERTFGVVRTGGIVVTVAGQPDNHLLHSHGVRGMFFVVKPDRGELNEITRLIERGKLRPFVESVYPLSKAREAFEHALQGHLGGKVVLRVTD